MRKQKLLLTKSEKRNKGRRAPRGDVYQEERVKDLAWKKKNRKTRAKSDH